MYGTKLYTYLANSNGFNNRYLSTIDSTISAIDTTIHYRYFTTTHNLTNYRRDVYDYQMNGATGDYSLFFYKRSQPRVLMANKATDNFVTEHSTEDNPTAPSNTDYIGSLKLSKDTVYVGEVDIRDYVFEDERKNYTHEKETVKVQEITDKGTAANDSIPKGFQLPASRNYRLNFATDYVVTQLNNSFSNQFYQNLSSPSSVTPGLSAFTKFGASDLFEDYKLVGGFRLSLDLSGIDFAASFENLKSRNDKKYIFLRQSSRMDDGFALYRQQTNMFIYQIKHPFNEVMALRISGIGRYDRTVRLSNELVSLGEKNSNGYNIGLKLEFVFDNTITKGLNLFNGTPSSTVRAARYGQSAISARITGLSVRMSMWWG